MIKVYCFGNTENGELGLGGIEDEHILTPRKQRLPYDRRKYNLVQLSSGRNHTLLLLKNIQLDQNFVFSCGSNERSQLGRNGSWKKLEQVDGLHQHNIVTISCGFNNCLVLSDNGQLFSWGCNLFGQLGHGNREEQEVGKPSLIKLLATKQIVQISCGGNHCLALAKNGEVYSWGSNAFGQLGLGTSGNCLSTPMLLTSLKYTPVRQVKAGGSHSAVLSCTGSIYVWGKNEFGQLGLNDLENRSLPTLQKSLRNQKIAYISMGDEHSAALTFEGGLFTWGAGMYGQLGHGKNTNEILPRQVFELMGVRLVQVSCGRCHTLVTSKLGRVYSFGLNGSGQLGIGSTLSKFLPSPIRGPWSEINTKDMILRDGERSVLLIDPSVEEEECKKIHVSSEEQTEFRKTSLASSKTADDLDMEIDEINEPDESTNVDDQSFIIEEPDEQNNSEKNVKTPIFIATDDAVYQREFVEIDEYETDPDSDWDEGPVRQQFIVKEIIASKGDQSFVMVQSFIDKALPKDFRKVSPGKEILRLQNDIFERFQTIPKESICDDVVEYIETTFTSIPAINASYFSVSSNEEEQNLNKIHKFKRYENITFDETMDFKDGCINWQQAFHGFNTIEDAQNEKIEDLIYQSILKILNDMPDLSFKNHKTKSEQFPEILDDEVLRIYQLLPLFHMFKMPSYSEKSQKLITNYSQAILNLSPRGIACLKIWWCKMNRRYFKNLVDILKNFIKINLLEQFKEYQKQEDSAADQSTSESENKSVQKLQIRQDIHINLARGLKVLKLLYSVNKFIEKLSYKDFYIEGMHEMFDLRYDYCMWKRNHLVIKEPEEYYLCNFPFIFDLPAKNIILSTDSEMQQQSAASFSMQKQILMQIPNQNQIVLNPYFQLNVRRDHLLDDTINQLCLLHKYGTEDLKKPLRVYFEGEEAVDAGRGMKKEFFLLLMTEILDKKYGMFVEYEETNTIWFNHAMNEEDDVMYKLIGIICGLAIYNQVIIDLPFPLILYKKILDEPLELDDLADLDPVLAKNLNEILNTQYGKEEFDALFGELNFVITLRTFGEPIEYELCPDGKTQKLTYENRKKYVESYWKFLLVNSIEKQFNSFYAGFLKVLDRDILKIFQAEELMQLVEGDDVVNWEELENSTKYKDEFNKDHPTIKLFWKVFYSFSSEEKKKFLKFLTGSDRIPTTGVKALNLLIQPMKVSEDHLPVAHTCFNILDLPLEYTASNKEEKMRSKLLQASELAVEFALV